LPSPPATGQTARPDSAAADSTGFRRETEFFLVSPQTAEIRLAHPFVQAASVQAIVDGRPWLAGADFRLRAKDGVWIPLRPLCPADGPQALVVLTYRFCPVPVFPRRDLHPFRSGPPDRAAAIPGTPALPVGGAAEEAAGRLNVHGSKSVRVSSGNRRELTVDQTLRLSISGKLTRDISVQATLSDDNLPVVPEGNTEELRDVDKILIELRAPTWQATLGDFVAERSGTVFGDYRRKLQGVSFVVEPGTVGAEALAGSPRGVYRTLQIRGEEANQGPYRLGAGDVGSNLFIVAGSEKVTLDGESLTRGADRDYVIDYVRGTVTFTYRRLITAESTIVVEFEAGEGPYARTVVGGGGRVSGDLPFGLGLPAELACRLVREKDDPDRLRTGSLAEEDRAILAAAGDDAGAALDRTVVAVADDQGNYDLAVVDGDTIYVFAPEGGDFDVSFFYVGPGDGDYALESLTETGERIFAYQGPGGGSYLIGRPLPLPESHSLVTMVARLGDAEQPRLRAEVNFSRRDLNQLSGLDDDDNAGTAWVLSGDTGEGELAPGGRSLGRFALQGRHEARDGRFRAFLLRKDLFTYDRWGLAGRAQRENFLEERDLETQLAGRWQAGAKGRRLGLRGEWGRLEHGQALTASRWAAVSSWQLGGGEGESRWEEATSRDRVDPLDVTRRRQRHQGSWRVLGVQPSAFYEDDSWRDAAVVGAAAGGARLRQWGGGLRSLPGQTWRWQGTWSRGLADSLRGAAWEEERDTRTTRLEVATPAVAGVRLTADGTLRKIVRRGGQEQTTRLAKMDLSGNWPGAGSDWTLGYRLDNSRTEVLDRQIVYVGELQGDYNELGDFVGRNQGDYNIAMVGTDSLVATTAVEADLVWRQDFGFLGRESIWGGWSTSTHILASGRSRTAEVGRLLRLDPVALFEDEEAVFGRVNFQQEVNLLRHLRWLDLRLRFDYDKTRDRQYATHPEDRWRRSYQGVATWAATQRSNLRLRTVHTNDNRQAAKAVFVTNRSFAAVTGQYEAEWAFRPTPGNRLAIAGEAIRRRDAVSLVKQREWAVRPSARVRLDRRWSLQAEMRWAEVTSEGPAGLKPFFFPVPGRNQEISARLAWDPTDNLTVSAVYFGRRWGESRWQHDVRMESTARF